MTSVTASFELAAGNIPIKVNKLKTEYITNADRIVLLDAGPIVKIKRSVSVSHVVKRSTENDYFDLVR